MSTNVRVVVDAMGGDHAPGEIVKGALQALEAQKNLTLVLVGRKKPLEAELRKYPYDKSRDCQGQVLPPPPGLVETETNYGRADKNREIFLLHFI